MRVFDVEVKTTRRFTENDLDNILCSCFEGGCGYWACLDNSTKEWKETREKLTEAKGEIPVMEDVMLDMLMNDKAIRLIDVEEDVAVYVTMESFLKGIRMSIENGFWSGEETMDVDGIVGDAIIQYAVYGEQVYG